MTMKRGASKKSTVTTSRWCNRQNPISPDPTPTRTKLVTSRPKFVMTCSQIWGLRSWSRSTYLQDLNPNLQALHPGPVVPVILLTLLPHIPRRLKGRLCCRLDAFRCLDASPSLPTHLTLNWLPLKIHLSRHFFISRNLRDASTFLANALWAFKNLRKDPHTHANSDVTYSCV